MIPSRPYGTSIRRPNIGITPDYAESRPDVAFPQYEIRVTYTDAVLRAGALPFVLPYTDDAVCVEAYLDRVSGLVVSGGNFDVPPAAYGEEPREGLGVLMRERTAFETALIRGALERNMPVLGICGGMQLLNVVMGGSLYQHLPLELQGVQEHVQKHHRSQPYHPVDVREGTQLAEALGKGQLMVNSTHHQAVNRLGESVVSTAVAPDGVVEAIESTKHTFAVGVQWHPEALIQALPLHLGLYRALAQKAREHRR